LSVPRTVTAAKGKSRLGMSLRALYLAARISTLVFCQVIKLEAATHEVNRFA
jgi:hypothetical protein